MHKAFTALLLTLYLATPALAEQIVVGTGDPAQDVPNVQTAVDAGGTVILQGTFNFGRDGRVKITKNTRIEGEKDLSGQPGTKINGGLWTFYAPLPVKGAPPKGRGPIMVVRNIHFDGAKGTPLHFPHVGGLDVRNCLVTEVSPQRIGVRWTDGDTLAFQAGIVVGNRLDHREKRIKRAAQGTIRIENNQFFMETNKPTRTAGYGIMVDWTWAADIAIRNNTVHRASRNGIEVLDNVIGPKGEGMIAVDSNRIITEEEGIPYPHKFGPNGIVAGWYFDTSGGANFSRNNRISLSGNRIEGRGKYSVGMLLYANDIVATCNDIVMGGGSDARGIVQTGSRGFFANNRVRGEASYALYCHPFEALRGETNTFAWTELNDFIGINGHIFLGGNVNVIIGPAPLLNDKGKGNRVVEASPCSLPEIDPEGEAWEPVE